MANEQNLRPFTSDQDREEAKKNGKKGGIASGKARRERKKFKEELILALETMKDGKTLQELGVEAVMKKFIDGDLQAFNIIRDTIGEKPVEKLEAEVKETTININLDDEE